LFMMLERSDEKVAVAEVAVIVEFTHELRDLSRGSDLVRNAAGKYTADASPSVGDSGSGAVATADGHEPLVGRLSHVASGKRVGCGDRGGLGGRDEGYGSGLGSRSGEGKTS